MLLPLSAAILLIGVSLLIHRWRIYPIAFTVMSLSLLMVGLTYIDSSGLWYHYALGVVVFLLGYFCTYIYLAVNEPGERSSAESLIKTLTPFEVIYLWTLTLIILGLVIYHFVVGGAPVFSSTVEIDRFNFTSSGLFGLPGRMYLYGLPLLVVYISMYHQKTLGNSDRTRIVLRVVWGAYIISRLLTGFKGAIIEILSTAIFIQAMTGNPLRLSKFKATSKYIALSVLAFIFAFSMAFKYESLRLKELADGFLYMIDRFTTISAQPVEYVLFSLGHSSAYVSFSGYFFYYFNDIAYFSQKYLHLDIMPQTVFPLDKIVSAGIYGVPLSYESFITPVTVGAFAESIINLGMAGGFIAMFAFGCIYYWFITRAKNSKRIGIAASFAYGVIVMHDFMTKGGLIYSIINAVAICTIFFMLSRLARFLAGIIFRSLRSNTSMPSRTFVYKS